MVDRVYATPYVWRSSSSWLSGRSDPGSLVSEIGMAADRSSAARGMDLSKAVNAVAARRNANKPLGGSRLRRCAPELFRSITHGWNDYLLLAAQESTR